MVVSPASLTLDYGKLSIESKKRDDKMKKLDPKKKEQMERLGMASTGIRQVLYDHSITAHNILGSVYETSAEYFSLPLIPGLGGGSPPQSVPGSSRGIVDLFVKLSPGHVSLLA